MKTITILTCLLLGQFASAQTYTVIADSLRLPIGLDVDAQGRLWVVESGYGFDDGALSIVAPDGALLPVLVNLPAYFDTTNQENVGAWHSYQLPGNQVAITVGSTGEVRTYDLTGFIPGVTPPLTAASSTSSLDVAAYALSHGFLESDPYTMAVDAQGNRYVADAAANAIFKADVNGQLSVFASFPPSPNPLPFGPPMYDAVPTGIVAKPGGGFYVCQLTGFPFLDGAASVFSLDQNGVATPFATGLTMLTDLYLEPTSGDLYVLQFGQFDLNIFNIAANSSKLIRIKPDGTQTVVASNLDLAAGFTLDAQGNLLVTELASGRILRLDGVTDAAEPVSQLTEVSLVPNPACDYVQFRFSMNESSPVTVKVLDAQGRTVFSQQMGTQEPGDHTFEWRRHHQPAGLYWVDFQTNKGTKTQQLMLR